MAADLRSGLVDTHCHLVLLDGRGMLDAALEAAAEAGVEQIITVGLNVDDTDQNRQIAERHRGVFFTVGWHPHQATPPDAQQLAALDALLHHERAVAVGEIGLDQYFRPGYHDTPLEVQQRSLSMMLELAATHHKPVVIHDRDAHDEVLAALVAAQRPGVMHCFSGDAEFGRRCTDAGLHLSFSGLATFPRTEGIQSAARTAPADRVLVETDAPFLAPVPYRGRPNQPAYVAATAAAVARLRGEDTPMLVARAAANARRLFGLPAPADGERLGGA